MICFSCNTLQAVLPPGNISHSIGLKLVTTSLKKKRKKFCLRVAVDTKKEEISLTQHATFVSLQPEEISRQILLSLFAEIDLTLELSLVTSQLIPVDFVFQTGTN